MQNHQRGQTRKKKQHYVPQTYLRRFCYDEKHLWVYDKALGKSFGQNIEDIAQEKYFNDVSENILGPDSSIDPQFVENALAQREDKLNLSLTALLETVEKKGISNVLRNEMARHLVTQMVRTRDFRNEIIEKEEAIEQALREIEVAQGLEPGASGEALWKDSDGTTHLRPRFTPEQTALIQASILFDQERFEEFAGILFYHIWFVGINRSPFPFFTSDNPIVRKPHLQSRHKSFAGIASPGIEIAYPLTPNHILVLCDRAFFRQRERYDGCFLILTDEAVRSYNRLQLMKSRRQIYCNMNEFALADEICREHPHICDPGRSAFRSGALGPPGERLLVWSYKDQE